MVKTHKYQNTAVARHIYLIPFYKIIGANMNLGIPSPANPRLLSLKKVDYG